MKPVLLIGASGQLGTDLAPALRERGYAVDAPGLDTLDITNHDQVRNHLRDLAPQLVINTAAFLRVDDCEDEHETAWRTNAFAVRNLAEGCQEVGATFVHISTDYVFGGGEKREPLLEIDCPAPLNVYGITKLAGEHAARAYCDHHLVVRSAGLYGVAGSRLKGGNFVETMLRVGREKTELRIVDDQWLTPTYTADLAPAIVDAVERGIRGLLHLTSGGACNWSEFATEIFRLAGLEVTVHPIPSSDYPTKAKRPPWSVLSNARWLAASGEALRPWQEALADYLDARSTE